MYKDILLPVDMGHEAEQTKAVETAVELAKSMGARLHVITVVPDFGMSIVGGFFPEGHEKAAIAKATEALHAFTARVIPNDIEIQHIVGHGSIYREILARAEQIKCDLIVMASHRPELQDYLLGPNAARVVRHATCSVMVVRG
ncbi:MAG: universal stress protein [Alphaproteobacteria bacterium]|nr:universal stress protein [Alphaproteobacteria bacterium]